MSRTEQALAECDRLIALYDGKYGWAATYTAMLRIGRDVLTRHHPDGLGGRSCCDECVGEWPCADAYPWLDLLAPEADA